MIVMKLGGMTIADAESVKKTAGIIKDRLHLKPVVVNSAMGKTTRQLLETALMAARREEKESMRSLENIKRIHSGMAKELFSAGAGAVLTRMEPFFNELDRLLEGLLGLGELTPRTQDRFLSFGELLATTLTDAYYREQGIPAVWMNAQDIIVTDDRFTNASPVMEPTAGNITGKVGSGLKSGHVPVIQGFIGSTRQGIPTTLGFEGSDLTATLIGNALDAEDIQIWKNVPGLMSADPAVCPSAYTLRHITDKEAEELTFFGAKVLHPAAMLPARQKHIPLHVCDINRPGHAGTEIVYEDRPCSNDIKSITCKQPMTLLQVRPRNVIPACEFMTEVLTRMDRDRIYPHIVSQSGNQVAAVIDGHIDLDALVAHLAPVAEYQMISGKASVTLVGPMRNKRRTMIAEMNRVCGDIPVDYMMHGVSPGNLTILTDRESAHDLVRRLHDHFFRETDPSVFETEETDH